MGMFTAILLAAGQSSRMGQPKGLMDWQGQPLIAHQARQILLSRMDQLIIVLGHQPNQYEPWIGFEDSRIQRIRNENWQEGKSSSIRKGLSVIEKSCKAILFVNVDQPVTAGIIDSLLNSLEQTKALIHIPICNGKRGHPILISAQLLNALREVNEDTQGLKRVIKDHPDQVADVSIDDPSILFNFNTIQDYQGRNTMWGSQKLE